MSPAHYRFKGQKAKVYDLWLAGSQQLVDVLRTANWKTEGQSLNDFWFSPQTAPPANGQEIDPDVTARNPHCLPQSIVDGNRESLPE